MWIIFVLFFKYNVTLCHACKQIVSVVKFWQGLRKMTQLPMLIWWQGGYRSNHCTLGVGLWCQDSHKTECSHHDWSSQKCLAQVLTEVSNYLSSVIGLKCDLSQGLKTFSIFKNSSHIKMKSCDTGAIKKTVSMYLWLSDGQMYQDGQCMGPSSCLCIWNWCIWLCLAGVMHDEAGKNW